MLNRVLKLYNLPFGFFGLMKFLRPSLLMVATVSLNASFISGAKVSTITYYFSP